MTINRNIVFAAMLFLAVISAVSCSEYQRALKSTNLDYKYDMAVMYYDQKEYYKALPLLEELVTVYRGTPNGEKLYYYLAYCNYYLEDLTMAGYYFESFSRVYPYSKYAEECLYMTSQCYYMSSPEYNLDQSNTYKAIAELQLFINRYPESRYIDECNKAIDELRGKLEMKAFQTALLYLKIENYKSAIVAFDNLLNNFPDTQYREEAGYLSLKSHYLLAMHSIPEKKSDRFRNTVKKYNEFIGIHSQSRYAKDASTINDQSLKQLAKVNHNTSNP